MAPPFKQAEFDILYGIGISREGSLIDFGVEHEIVRKSGAWYTYDGDQLGQGKENSRKFLTDNPTIALEIEQKIMRKLGVGAEAKAANAAAAVAEAATVAKTAAKDAKAAGKVSTGPAPIAVTPDADAFPEPALKAVGE
jgi:recombination protein RecA